MIAFARVRLEYRILSGMAQVRCVSGDFSHEFKGSL
jgi:hypothetical protein